MILYKDYELSDALFDLPCKVGITNIYPTLLKDKKQFDKYCNYILLSKKHINMPDTLDSTLKLIISYFVLVKKEENNNKKNDSLIHLEVINELENLFSIVCRENITFEFNDYKFEFKNDLGTPSAVKTLFCMKLISSIDVIFCAACNVSIAVGSCPGLTGKK